MSSPTPPRAVVFDLEGTLLETLDARYEAQVLALREVAGADVARAWRLDDARVSAALSPEAFARQAAPAHARRVARRFEELYPAIAGRAARPYDDVAPALEALAAAKVPLAVATDGPAAFALELLGRFGLTRRFRAVFGASDQAPRKPHPWLLVEAARALAVPPRALAFVGDGIEDVALARAAGAHAWVIGRGARGPEGDRALGSLEELPRLLRPGP